jgi:hypothetical protein
VTATSWRTDYRIGTAGHRLTIAKRGRVIADTGWHPSFAAAAAAYAPLLVSVCEAGRARYLEDDEAA